MNEAKTKLVMSSTYGIVDRRERDKENLVFGALPNSMPLSERLDTTNRIMRALASIQLEEVKSD